MPMHGVSTQRGDAVSREEDRVIIGAPDPEPTHLVGRSPGPVWHERVAETEAERDGEGVTI